MQIGRMLGCCVVLHSDSDNDFQYIFGEVEFSFAVGESIYLCCHILSVQEYNRHFHAYVLNDTGQYSVRSVTELSDCNPLGLYHVNGHKAVVLKYHKPY